MTRLATRSALAALLLISSTTGAPAGQTVELDGAMRAFWEAASPTEARTAAQRVVEGRPAFDVVWQRLRAGRPYGQAKRGLQLVRRAVSGEMLDNAVDIPRNYDPARPWPVRVQLHGGVGRPLRGAGSTPPGATNRIAGANQIYIHPRAWATAPWWYANQVDNVLALLDHVKRTYNVDESRVSLTGISDGGTGTYFYAMREATPWASCLPLNGSMLVLANPDVRADGELFLDNLTNCPFYIVNGGKDPLYPAKAVAPVVAAMERIGVPLVFRVHPEAGHNTEWWPEERGPYEKYVRDHPRVSHPRKISWSTERVDRYNRFRWLVVDRLGPRPSDTVFDGPATLAIALAGGHPSATTPPFGRVDVERAEQTFLARTSGVSEFTLLLSRDVVDFSRPVKVSVNGRVVFDGRISEDLETLLDWAARDNDRSMLYGAALKVPVP